MKEHKNVLIVTSEFPPKPGGIGNHAYNLASQLTTNKFKVRVIADQRIENIDEELDFDKTQPFNVVRIRLKKNTLFDVYQSCSSCF